MEQFLEFVIGLLRAGNPLPLLKRQTRGELLQKWRQASTPEKLSYSVIALSALLLYGLGCALVVIILRAVN